MVEHDKMARRRAFMPEGTSEILNARTLERSHRRLGELVKPGMWVLDVGCGTGAITAGIAQRVAPAGRAVGVDVNARLIREAGERHRELPCLEFVERDVYELGYDKVFDITTSARVLQWLSNPGAALEAMIQATKPGGRVVVLDYNHEKLRWEPEPPASVRRFYDAFLQWRADAGMENAIADHLESMFTRAGLRHVEVTSQIEESHRRDPDFSDRVGIWAALMASRGRQMVADQAVTEAERAAAEREYREWMQDAAQTQAMYLLSVEGVTLKA